jgi:glycosidase
MSQETSKNLRDLLIYQVYVRNYSEEGTFKALEKDLVRIKDMGVDVLYLLPIHPIGEKNRKGELGSPYAIKDYYGINEELGNLEDFKSLIQETHNLDMKIMMDIVFNHTSHDSVLSIEHPEYFFKRDGQFDNKVGDWWDIIDLDYHQKGLWTYLIDVMKYWTKLGIDGYRFDVASLLPLDFLSEMKKEVLKINPETIFLSESVHGGFCRYLRNQGFHCLSESEVFQVFDMAYDYDIHPYFEGYLKGELPFKRYAEELLRQEEIYPSNYIKMRNLENHDFGRFAPMVNNDKDKILQWLALTFFSRGSTMIYNGQEYLNDHLPDLFNKDVFKRSNKDISKEIYLLNKITKGKITSHGSYDIIMQEDDIFVGQYIYENDSLWGIFNLSLAERLVDVTMNDGTYQNLFTNEPIEVVNQEIRVKDQPIIIKT